MRDWNYYGLKKAVNELGKGKEEEATGVLYPEEVP
jgi:hypothetical protein